MEVWRLADSNTKFTSRITGESVSPASILALQLSHLQEIVAEGNSIITDANIGSELRNILESIDLGFYQQLFELNEYGEQTFLRYARNNWLDEKAFDYGFSRGVGERASGYVTFSLSSPPKTDYTIYEGTELLNVATGLTYVLTDDVYFSVEDTTATGWVIAEHIGSEYNCDADSITVIDSEWDMPSDLTVTNVAPFINGEDMESDESLRMRILEGLRGGNFGSKQYYKSLCEEIENVHDVNFVSPVLLNSKYGQGRHTVTVNGVSTVCNECTNVCVVNYDSKDDNNDDTLRRVTGLMTNQDNLVLGHEFHVQDALKEKYFFKIAYYGENGATVSETDVNACLETLFYGGTYEGKESIYYEGYDIGSTIYKSEIINALENMSNIHHVENIQRLGYHMDMPTIALTERWYHDNGNTNMTYHDILDYPDEDDQFWKQHLNSSIPHWKRIDANYNLSEGNTIYQLEIEDYFFYKIKDSTHSANNTGEYARTFNENENLYWLWGQKAFNTITLPEDACAMVGALYEKQPKLHNNVTNTHIFQLEKLDGQ